MIICIKFSSPSTRVIAQDLRNDCIANTGAIAFAYIGTYYWRYVDPIGAILISIYIAVNWYGTCKEQVAILSGKSASPEFITRIINVCCEHDPLIKSIDTVLAYHFGTKYLVEVHVVMDAENSLKTVHDTSEKLQNKVEALPFVERAFVHVDYECDHRPASEHKIV